MIEWSIKVALGHVYELVPYVAFVLIRIRPKRVKKSLESDYPRPQAGAFRPIHGYATAISC
jgi:hypothetical protein